MATESFLTELSKMLANQFSALYNILGHYKMPLNSHFDPFTGQTIEQMQKLICICK